MLWMLSNACLAPGTRADLPTCSKFTRAADVKFSLNVEARLVQNCAQRDLTITVWKPAAFPEAMFRVLSSKKI
jgi:hypothetical protein